MSRVQMKTMTWLAALCLLFSLFVPSALAKPQADTSTQQTTPPTTTKTTKKKSSKSKKDQAPSDQAAASAGTTDSSTTPTSTKKSSSHKTASAGSASVSEIAAAKAKGEVWVNLDTGIYHKGGRWYGKTKNGKFMTQQEAKAAGYKESKKD